MPNSSPHLRVIHHQCDVGVRGIQNRVAQSNCHMEGSFGPHNKSSAQKGIVSGLFVWKPLISSAITMGLRYRTDSRFSTHIHSMTRANNLSSLCRNYNHNHPYRILFIGSYAVDNEKCFCHISPLSALCRPVSKSRTWSHLLFQMVRSQCQPTQLSKSLAVHAAALLCGLFSRAT